MAISRIIWRAFDKNMGPKYKWLATHNNDQCNNQISNGCYKFCQ